jgi:hypothetical protein
MQLLWRMSLQTGSVRLLMSFENPTALPLLSTKVIFFKFTWSSTCNSPEAFRGRILLECNQTHLSFTSPGFQLFAFRKLREGLQLVGDHKNESTFTFTEGNESWAEIGSTVFFIAATSVESYYWKLKIRDVFPLVSELVSEESTLESSCRSHNSVASLFRTQ